METNSASNIFTFCILTKIAAKLSTYTNNHIFCIKPTKILGIAKQPNAKVILMPESYKTNNLTITGWFRHKKLSKATLLNKSCKRLP
jgi:hypothetical protein